MTTENNKIIAEFMYNKNYLYNNDKYSSYFFLTDSEGNELKESYDNDWNWLMEVVEKIETIEEQRFLFQISSRQGFYAEVRERFYYDEKIEDSWGNTRIEAVYKACVEFIKWYNEQKKV